MKRPARLADIMTVAPRNKPTAILFGRTGALCLLLASHIGRAQQSSPQETPQQEIRDLTLAVDKAQTQLDASQQQLFELKRSLTALEQRLAKEDPPSSATVSSATVRTPAAPPASQQPPPAQDDLRERQAMQESQIATLDQAKVESASKYPVKISGLILFNGFINTSQVDVASAPTEAVVGGGSTGASLRQTILGVDARGPSLGSATSHADLRVDFFGSPSSSTSQTSYANVGGLLRSRTAHATLEWAHSQAFVEMDRPIISPNAPTSLVAVANPPLAWSGNLWAWSPQIGISHTIALGASSHLALEAALIDVPDAPTSAVTSTGTASQAEHSRWPGSEIHLELLGKQDGTGPAIGFGGYFGPHKTPGGSSFNAWAATLDFDVPLPMGVEMSGSFYRGLALGGLGGGAYKDYIYGGGESLPLNDVGGWLQLKKKAGQRLEFNGTFGMDNAFASELRDYLSANPSGYQNLARNQTFFANTIYSPSSYLLFSLEVRHIASTPITGASANSNIIGIAAGYQF